MHVVQKVFQKDQFLYMTGHTTRNFHVKLGLSLPHRMGKMCKMVKFLYFLPFQGSQPIFSSAYITKVESE